MGTQLHTRGRLLYALLLVVLAPAVAPHASAKGAPRRRGRRRRLALSLGLALALALSAGPVPPSAAATVATLSGETLTGSSTSPTNGGLCPTASYTVSGTAAAPYPGSFAETGTIFGPTLTATFTIASGGALVTGSLTQGGGRFTTSCGPLSGGYQGTALYTATIQTLSGTYRDEGTVAVDVTITGVTATLTERFTSSLAQPVLIGPPRPAP